MKILVALSGGVDSAVVAALLQEQGHEVHAGFMINYLTDDESCTTKKDLNVARDVAAHLGIPLYTFDFVREYEERIISLIYRGYEKGETPNPDIWCNNLVKFDLFAEEARQAGYDAIATGHYATIMREADWNYLIHGQDHTKDQSYFLSRLTQAQLSYALMPLGIYPKSRVREMAQIFGLPNADRKDSQGLCFIGKVSMQDFLGERLTQNPGDIITTDGIIVGQHIGLWRYTIGQRKGIEVGGGPALYVVAKDQRYNRLIVGDMNDPRRKQKQFYISEVNFLIPKIELNTLISNHLDQITGEIRYHQSPQKISCIIKTKNGYKIEFSDPQKGGSVGQAVVLSHGSTCILSGIITHIGATESSLEILELEEEIYDGSSQQKKE